MQYFEIILKFKADTTNNQTDVAMHIKYFWTVDASLIHKKITQNIIYYSIRQVAKKSTKYGKNWKKFQHASEKTSVN